VGTDADAAGSNTVGADADAASDNTQGADAASANTQGTDADAASGSTQSADADAAGGNTQGGDADAASANTQDADADAASGNTQGPDADAANGTQDANADSAGDGAQSADSAADATTSTDASADVAPDMGSPATGFASVLTEHDDVARTGANLNETQLTTANVNPTHFGKIFARPVDDSIYAQPLVLANVQVPGKGLRNVVYVATMNDSVYAFDADNAAETSAFWTVSFLNAANGVTPVSHNDVGQACGNPYPDILGNIGIESTPVIDPTGGGTLYVVAKTKEAGQAVYRLHALDAATGAERPTSPVRIDAVAMGIGDESDGGTIPFDPWIENQRAALLLANGTLYITFSSYCDTGFYHGWVLAYDSATLQQTATFNASPDGKGAGIWMSGQGPAADPSGNVFLSIGNGTTDVQNGGRDLSEGIVKLTPQLALVDWFIPFNFTAYNNNDVDLGAGGVMLMPDMPWVVTVSKAGTLYVNDTGNLGKYHAGDDSQIVQSIALGSAEIHGGATTWTIPGGSRVYVWPSDDVLRSFTVTGGQLGSSAAGTTMGLWPGGVLSLSANGAASATGIVWATLPANGNPMVGQVPGVLRAISASSVATELWNSLDNAARDDCGAYAKFNPATVVNGKVYLASFAGQFCVYGILP